MWNCNMFFLICIHILDLFPGYKKVTKKTCASKFRSHSDAFEAQKNCDKNKHCSAIYTTDCNNKGNYHLCYEDEIRDSGASYKCIFQKGVNVGFYKSYQ